MCVPPCITAGQVQQHLVGAAAADQRQPERAAVERRQRKIDLRQAAEPGDAQQAHRLVAVDDFELMLLGAAQRRDARRGRQDQDVALAEQRLRGARRPPHARPSWRRFRRRRAAMPSLRRSAIAVPIRGFVLSIHGPWFAQISEPCTTRKISIQPLSPPGLTVISSTRGTNRATASIAPRTASATGGSTSANASRAIRSRCGLAGSPRFSRSTRPTRRKTSASRANHPTTSKLAANGAMPVERHAPVRRPDAEDAAVARRQAHRAAAVGAEREIDEPGGNRGRRSARRAARHAVGARAC